MLIVIGSNKERWHWGLDASNSIERYHEIVMADGYELGKIRTVYETTNVDRFLFLQDSFLVKDQRFFDLLDEYEGSVSINKDPYFYGCYAGVYERKVLDELEIPIITTKRQAVEEEINFHKRYIEISGEVPVLFPEFTDASSTRTEIRHGRENLVIENDYLVKYKGTWRYDQI